MFVVVVVPPPLFGHGLILDAVLFAPPPTGRTTLGHGPADINIQGPGVAPRHCFIENKCGVITLHPCGNMCAVDGLQLTQPARLSQGRRPLLITDRLSAGPINPPEAALTGWEGGSGKPEQPEQGVIYTDPRKVRSSGSGVTGVRHRERRLLFAGG